MKRLLLAIAILLAGIAEAQVVGPTGFLRQSLREGRALRSIRIDTHAEMVARCVAGQPRQFLVQNDEVTGETEVMYYWDGFKAYKYGTGEGGGEGIGYTPPNIAVKYKDPEWIDSLSKVKVGLGSVDNTSDASKPLSTAMVSALAGKQAVLGFTPVNIAGSYTDPSFINSLAKSKVGLGNVENYSAANMPLSTAATNALNNKADATALSSGLAGKFGLSDANTVTGANSYSALQSYRAPWAGGQGFFGSTGQAGRILFARSSDGAGSAWVGYRSAGQNNDFGMSVSGSSGSIDLATAGGTGIKVFSDARTVVKRGGTPTNNGTHDFQVDGSQSVSAFVKIGGGVNLNPDSLLTFANNAAALAGGLPPGKLYKSVVDDEWLIKMTHAPSGSPIFTESLSNLVTRTLFVGTSSERKYKSQNDPRATWAITKTSGATGIPPVFRFESRPGDVWPTDTVNGNDQNGKWKERTEMYNINTSTNLGYNTPWEIVQWVSYRIFVEPGGDVVYTNNDHYCDLGQWHAKTGAGQATIFIKFDGADRFRFYTHGGTTGGSGTLRHTANLARGQWHNIVMRIKHSQTAGQGEFRLYINSATPVLNLTGIDLGVRPESDAGYWKWGIYRTAANEDKAVTLSVQYANMEISASDLSARATSGLPLVP